MNSLAWLSRLIAIDTTSRNSNLQLIHLIQEWLHQQGLIQRLTYDSSKTKANLFATIPAKNGSINGGIILSGHTDVVPVDGQDWLTNPFEAVQADNKIYGRGACDMKGFLAVALSLIPDFKKMQLAYPLHFAFSYDEEIGCCGAPLMIDDFEKADIKPQACIVGEPTDMRPVIAHKGIQLFRCRVHGQAAHSSLTTQGCNAIEYAAKLICYIRELADQIKNEGPFDTDFDVPFTSLTTNMIHGGTAHNIIPELCEFFFEFRQLPQVQPSMIINKIQSYIERDLLPSMQKAIYKDMHKDAHKETHNEIQKDAHKEMRKDAQEDIQQNVKKENFAAKIELDNIAIAPSFETSDCKPIQEFKKLLGDTKIHKVAYATEAGIFQRSHIPTIVCGPGNIEQAHRANEFVKLEQLEKCEKFLREAVKINLN